MRKMELLAPAGDLSKLKIAIEYGADAVYFGGEAFGLRSAAGNFTIQEIKQGVTFAHERGKKVYMTMNIFAHNEDINALSGYLEKIKDFDIDAFIVSDPGMIDEIKELMPNAEIHLSTQANTTNYKTASFWHRNGVQRIVLARELSFEQIQELREKTPETLALEAFIHGAMCISYSGRCLLSNYMVHRDANRGECAQPCRWGYHIVEEKRPGEYIPVEEDEHGTYFFNSKDLCMIGHIPDLIKSGIESFKIEGRMKSIFYLAVTTGIYRKAIDAYYENPQTFSYDPAWLTELEKVSHRSFSTGFYYGQPNQEGQNYSSSSYVMDYGFVGLVLDYDEKTGFATIEQRNKMCKGDIIEVFGPKADFYEQTIEEMRNEDGEPIDAAPHAQQIITMKMKEKVGKNFMLRKRLSSNPLG